MLEQKNHNRGKTSRHPNFRYEHDSVWSSLPMRLIIVVSLTFVIVLAYDQFHGKRNLQAVTANPPRPSSEGLAEPATKPTNLDVSTTARQTQAANRTDNTKTVNVAQQPRQMPANPPPIPAEKVFETYQYVMEKDSFGNMMGLGSINGKNVMFLADTGATTVVVPEKLANKIGLRKGVPIPFKTGGGVIVHYATTLDSLTLGKIEIRNVAAAINPAMQDEFVLLGMSALGLMDVQIDRGNLVLKYRASPSDAVEPKPIVNDEPFKRSYKDCAKQGNKFDKNTLDCLNGK